MLNQRVVDDGDGLQGISKCHIFSTKIYFYKFFFSIKSFRVSPTSSDEGDTTGQRRIKTAPPRNSGQDPEDSPPDPLEPWSTRDLMNINQLLDQNDSPLVGDEPTPGPQDPPEEQEEEE